MRKSIIIFILVVLSFFVGHSFNEVKAAKVSSNGDFTIRGEKFNINTTLAREGGNEPIKKVQMYKDKTVSEICKYTESNEDDPRDVKWLFIYSDGSASVGWQGETLTWLFGDEEFEDADDYESRVMNWNGGVTSSKWDGENSNLTKDYDAYNVYKNFGKCPYYLVLNENLKKNYIYLSNEEGFDNLDKLQKIAATPQGEKGGTVHTFYSIDDIKDSSRKDLVCEYEDGDGKDEKIFQLTFDEDGNPSASLINNKPYGFKVLGVKDYSAKTVHLTSNFQSNKYWSYVESGKCPKTIYSCFTLNHTVPDIVNVAIPFKRLSRVAAAEIAKHLSGLETAELKLYGDESIVDSGECNSWDKNIIKFYCMGDDNCSSGECGRYSDFYRYTKEKIKAYTECDKKDYNCRKDSLSEYNDSKDTIIGFCDSVLKNLNYSKGGCVDACLNLSKDITALEIEAELRLGYSETKCNIGESVLNIVYNVLKWAKYIVPALVVILSILDFIKAIASQSEDDMKKAQGKFVKRLIVAAILFLLPLIINFMLKTFGLYSSECDITNLFG